MNTSLSPKPDPQPPFSRKEHALATLAPIDASLESSWYLPEFDDSAWLSGTPDSVTKTIPGDYLGLIETRVKPSESVSNGTSVYQRFHFNVADSPSSDLVLRMRYDDGFVAYLNGKEIARENINGTVRYNSTASSHPDSQAVNFVEFPLPGVSLIPGENVLAIQIINQSSGSSDLLCEPELVDRRVPMVDTLRAS